MSAALSELTALSALARWPLELTLATTVCLGLAWCLDVAFRKRSAAIDDWRLGFSVRF